MIPPEYFNLDLEAFRKDGILPRWTEPLQRHHKLLWKALQHGDGSESMQDIASALNTQRYQIWHGEKSCVITEVWECPTELVICHCILTAGNMDELQDLRIIIEDFARKMGCHRIQARGHPGWMRHWATNDAGYDIKAVYVAKES